jgi:glycosyltransferase involved in cell wall biosynthesis
VHPESLTQTTLSPAQEPSTRKPCILFVLQYHYIQFTGGAEVKSWILATELVRRGWDVHYASEWSQTLPANPLEGVTLHPLPANPSRWWGNRQALREVMDKVQPDVVYNRVFDLYTLHAVEEAPKNALTVWAMAITGDGLVWSHIAELSRTWPLHVLLRRIPAIWHTRSSAARGMRRAGLAITQIRDHQKQLEQIGVKSELIYNHARPVPDSEVQRQEGRPTILWVASVKSWKRPQLFVDLARSCSDLAADFVMVGQVQEERCRHIVEEAAALPNFRYLGYKPPSEIGPVYAKAALFVSTSRSEALPDTFIQSWMRGVPVVALDVDPDGLLTDPGLGVYVHSTQELEKTVRELVNDPVKRKEMGAKARAFAVKEFDLQANVDKFERLLAERGVRLPSAEE